MSDLQTINALFDNVARQEVPGTNVSPLFKAVCTRLSLDVAEICSIAKSGHLGGSLSSLELFSTLYFGGHFRFSVEDPKHPDRDRLLVRGHLGPLRYPLFSLLGWVDETELATYRRLDSRLHGHESMLDLPGIDITPSGSLGMVLSYGVGSSIVSRRRDTPFQTYVFLGDGEEQEGNISEAARHAANLRLGNLTCILDANGKQYSRPVDDNNSESDVATIWRGYGWNVIKLIEGHDPIKISAAYEEARNTQDKPTLIIAQTIKGNGMLGAEDNFCGYHTINYCPADALDEFIDRRRAEMLAAGMGRDDLRHELLSLAKPYATEKVVSTPRTAPAALPPIAPTEVRDMDFNNANAWYYARLTSNAAQAGAPALYFLTADLLPKHLLPKCGLDGFPTFFDIGLREQHMFAMAHGISATDPDARVHICGAEAFTYRALDQLNVLGQGKSNVVIIADKAGLSNSRNGPTHQSSAQPFAVNWQPNTTFLEPSDAEDLFACLNTAFSRNDGVYYIRSHSLSPGVLPKKGFSSNAITPYYQVGDAVDNPDVTLIGSGITTHNLWKTLPNLAEKGISARLINITAPRLLDKGFSAMIAEEKPCLCFYNGHPAFLPSLVSLSTMSHTARRPSFIKGYGFEIGASGTVEELMTNFGLDGTALVDTILNGVSGITHPARPEDMMASNRGTGTDPE